MEFLNDDCKRKFMLDMRNRSVDYCMNVDFRGWESLGIQEMFDRIGLSGLYSLSGDRCERIVRLFYANCTATSSNGVFSGLRTYILGTEVLVTAAIVNVLVDFDIDIDDAEQYYHMNRDCPFFAMPEGVEFLRKISINSNIGVFARPRTRDLNVKGRVIRSMLAHTILPRDGHRDQVSCMDLYVMEKLWNEKPFDPGFIILRHMQESMRAPRTSLLYGALILRIIEYAGIQLPGDERRIRHITTNEFNIIHLTRMGLEEVDGTWVLKTRQRTRASTSRAVSIEESTSPPLAPQGEEAGGWDQRQYLQQMYEMQQTNHQQLIQMQEKHHQQLFQMQETHHQQLHHIQQEQQMHQQHLHQILEIQQSHQQDMQRLLGRVDDLHAGQHGLSDRFDRWMANNDNQPADDDPPM